MRDAQGRFQRTVVNLTSTAELRIVWIAEACELRVEDELIGMGDGGGMEIKRRVRVLFLLQLRAADVGQLRQCIDTVGIRLGLAIGNPLHFLQKFVRVAVQLVGQRIAAEELHRPVTRLRTFARIATANRPVGYAAHCEL